jgi:hypothetical protein
MGVFMIVAAFRTDWRKPILIYVAYFAVYGFKSPRTTDTGRVGIA